MKIVTKKHDEPCCDCRDEGYGGAAVHVSKPGPPGAAATIEIEDVVTIEPNDPARVENVGDTSAAKLVLYIPKGDPGNIGAAATIEIQDVVTIEPDDPARVENLGDENNAKLVMYIPKGDKGDEGDTADGAVLYTEQNLTNVQQKQARDNIGFSTAVNEAIANALENVETDREIFYANSDDTTYAELKAAYDAGKLLVYVDKYTGCVTPISRYDDDNDEFVFIDDYNDPKARTVKTCSSTGWHVLFAKAAYEMGTVSFAEVQTLTDTQKAQAKANLGITDSGADDSDSIFIAVYGETSYEEIAEAISQGKACFCIMRGMENIVLPYVLRKTWGNLGYIFAANTNAGYSLIQAVCEQNNGWTTEFLGMADAAQVVSYNYSQSLTDAQKTQARANIGAASGSIKHFALEDYGLVVPISGESVRPNIDTSEMRAELEANRPISLSFLVEVENYQGNIVQLWWSGIPTVSLNGGDWWDLRIFGAVAKDITVVFEVDANLTARQVIDNSANAVLFTEQTLTEEQKAQVRANIGAATVEDVLTALPTWTGGSY